MRVSRQWRDLVNRKCFGWAHKKPESNEMEGSLALFCPACPQPGINLEDDWRQRYPEYKLLIFSILVILICFFRWLMCRRIVTDGNFKAELLKPKNPEIDVALTAGGRYVTEKERYGKHLKEGKVFTQGKLDLCIYHQF